MKSIEVSKIERLKYLLKQTEIFSHFLVGPKNQHEHASVMQAKFGKKAIRKRAKEVEKDNNLLRSLKEIENNDDNDFEEHTPTREAPTATQTPVRHDPMPGSWRGFQL